MERAQTSTGAFHYKKKQNAWFDQTQFSIPTPAWAGGPNQGFGDAGKDAVVGPGRVDFNTSVYKNFAIRERANFELRVESFNTFNHTQFNGVSSGFQGFLKDGTPKGNFGQITSTYDPRVIELGGRFSF